MIGHGNTDRDKQTIYHVEAVYRHIHFTHGNRTYDVALLKLSSSSFDAGTWVKLPTEDQEIPLGLPLTVSGGWGYTSQSAQNEKIIPDRMRWTRVYPMDQTVCQKKIRHWRREELHSTQVCVRNVVENTNPCVGDSGTALVDADNVQLALISFGSGHCDVASEPVIATRIPPLVGWINDTIRRNSAK